MKRFILLLASLIGCATIASAQIYNETLLFIKVGETIESSENIVYIHFDDNGSLYSISMSKESARAKYNAGTLMEYGINQKHTFKYCSNTSTSKYKVFKEKRYDSWYGVGYMELQAREHRTYIGGYWYKAISLDRNEMICWYTTADSNEPKNKIYYKRIESQNLIPKEVEYDFLY